jgi:hypothetical protein
MRPRDIAAPFCSLTAARVHLLQFLQRADLLAEFLAISDGVVR